MPENPRSKYESIDRCYFCKLPCDKSPGESRYCGSTVGMGMDDEKPWVLDFLRNNIGKKYGYVDGRTRRGKNFLKLVGRRK
jgi:hypothetical protein